MSAEERVWGKWLNQEKILRFRERKTDAFQGIGV